MGFIASEITRSLKRYDRDLFCAPASDGVLCVYRKHKRVTPVWEHEDFTLSSVIEDKQLIFALTDNWSRRGTPRAWGTDFILNRLREIDAQANERLLEDFEKAEVRAQESKDRDLTNHLEAWASDSRRAFAKATDDILVHSLSKDEPRKRRKDRSIKNGNY